MSHTPPRDVGARRARAGLVFHTRQARHDDSETSCHARLAGCAGSQDNATVSLIPRIPYRLRK